MKYRLLGALEVQNGDGPIALGGPKQRAFLGLLLVNANQVVSRDRLIDELWGEEPPPSAVQSIQVYVSRLRKLLPPDTLLTRTTGYVLEVDPNDVDLSCFEGLLAEGRKALAAHDPQRATEVLHEALDLWRGPPLAEFAFEPFAQAVIGRLEELRLAALEDRIEADLELGRDAELIAELEALIAENPHRERLRGQLMLALYRSERQAEALEVYRRGRRTLDELGIEPSAVLQQLEKAILNHDPALQARSRAARSREGVVLPGPLGVTPPFPFVGRSVEVETLRALWALAASQGGRVALISGEAGSGKTRLVREFAREAADDGVLVLYGVSDAVVATPYQPFVESLEFLVRALDPGTLRESLATGGGELTRLLPDLPLRVGPLPPPATADPGSERYRLHAAVADVLSGASRRQPVLLVIDDMHWADAPSLHLFRHLARTASEGNLLVVATFRDSAEDLRPEFADALADLSRAGGVTRLALRRLSNEALAEFIQRAGRADANGQLPTLVDAIDELTGGNPFLVCELWRSLTESGTVEISEGNVRITRPIGELGTPESVRDVVQSRLSRLAPSTIAMLQVAAVAGRQFELRVLEVAALLTDGIRASALDEAVDGGMIEEIPSARLAHRFTHELVRRALYAQLSSIRRAELHLRVGEALERVNVSNPTRVLTELAYHFAAASALGGAERAVEYNLRAAEAAKASLAFEEAAARFATALEVGIADEVERARVQLELGDVYEKVAQAPEALAAFRSAATLARSRGDAEMLARAAIGFERACWTPLLADHGGTAIELLREAATALGGADSTLQARTLDALGRALTFAGEHEEASDVRSRSIAMARRLGDRPTLATALTRAYWAKDTVPLRDVLEMLTEALDLGLELGDAEIVARANRSRVLTLVDLCDLEGARRELTSMRRSSEQTRQLALIKVCDLFGSALALCDGRLDDAEVMAERYLEASRVLGLDSSASHSMQLFGIRREQGRLDELRPAVQVLARIGRGDWAFQPGLLALLVEVGMHDEAREELGRMRADGFAGIPHDFKIASLVYLTDACAALGDAASAALLYPELKPLSGGNVMVGQLVACYGAADRYLGMLAAAMGEWECASAHFESAFALNRRMNAHTWTAHTAYEYGRMLLTRGRTADRVKARELLAEASWSSERLGLHALRDKLRMLGQHAGVHAPPDGLSARTIDVPSPVAHEQQDGLSGREIGVLRLVSQGQSNREIGRELAISEHTVANHVRSILRKTGCANRTDAASYAHLRGLVGERPWE
jgi:DNA-binding SARP family transcriptional activator/DNA-binding CsgD family transcriptional regulator